MSLAEFKKIPVSDEDIFRVRAHMMAFHCGYRNACPRQKIASHLGMTDRLFRDVCAEIPEVFTSVHYGYWILPLVDETGEEVRVAKDVLENEDRRRVIALYMRTRRQRHAVRKLEGVRQQEFSFA